MNEDFEKELEELINRLWDEIPYYTEEELAEIEYLNDIEDDHYDWTREIEEQLGFEASLDDVEPPTWEVWVDEDGVIHIKQRSKDDDEPNN